MAKPTSLPEWDTTQVNSIEPDSTHKAQGWLAPGGVPEKPPYQTFNHWQNHVYEWLNEINIHGILIYDATTDYVGNLSFVAGSDNKIYKCNVDNGPSSSVVNPVGDTTGTWEVYDSDLYIADPAQADQGATSANPNTNTIYDIITAVGTSKKAVIRLKHDPGAGLITYYTFDTSLDLSSYGNIFIMLDIGAELVRTTGDEVFTIFSPDRVLLQHRGQRITTVEMLAFAEGGIVYPEWWGAVSDGSTDCTNAIQWAIAAMADTTNVGVVKFLPAISNYNITAQITQYGGVAVIGEGFTGVKIANTTTTASMWSLGDLTLDRNGDFCVLKNFQFLHTATGGSTDCLEILGAFSDGLSTASRFWLVENIVIGGGAGRNAIRISGYSGAMKNIKVSGWVNHLVMDEQCNDLLIERFNSSADTGYAIVSSSGLTSPPLNVAFHEATIQLHNHATHPAILIDGGRDVSFYNTYFEKNYLGGSAKDVIVGDECRGVSFYNTTRTDAGTDDVGISSAAENTKIDGFWDNTSSLYSLEFTGAIVRQASIKDVFNTNAALQALVHDQSSYGVIFEKRENLFPNSSMFIVDGGTSWSNPANGDTVFDVWTIEKVDGAGTAPTVNVARNTISPSHKIPYSVQLEITDVGTADSGRRWKLKMPFPDPELLDGQDMFFSLMLRASTTITFTAAKVLVIDSSGNTQKAITELDTTWQTFNILHSMASGAPSTLEFHLILDAGSGTISTTGSIYACAFVGAIGRNPSCFYPNPGYQDRAQVDYITP